jgi:hypothetical protein
VTDYIDVRDDELADGQVFKRSGTDIVGVLAAEITSGATAPSSTPAKVGDIYVDTVGLAMYVAVGTDDSGDWSLVANDSSHAAIEVGASAPASTPGKVGDVYIDTTADVAYISVGTASSADWASAAPGTVTVPHYHTFTFPDTFTSTAGAEGIGSAWRAPVTGALVKVIIWCDTAPANGVITVDIHKNGTTVFTGGTGRPSIAISATADESDTPSVTTMAAGDLFQPQVDAIHASDIGNCGRLFVMLWWTQTVAL